MAEKNSELDVINHLLEIEKNASILINDAMIEADKRVNETKVRYNAEFKTRFETIAAEKDKEYHDKLEEISKKHKIEIEEYKKSLEQKNQNTEVFNQTLEKLLFAE